MEAITARLESRRRRDPAAHRGARARLTRPVRSLAAAAFAVVSLLATPGTATAGPFITPIDGGSVIAGCDFDSTSCNSNGLHHTGVDWNGQTIRAIGDGVVEVVQPNDGSDENLGRTVILRHETTAGIVRSQYSHMASFGSGLVVGECVPGGHVVGTVGASGGGSETHWPHPHLHLEMKTTAVLGEPSGRYWGYTPGPARDYGYVNPGDYIGRAQTTLECGVGKFDQPRVFSSDTLEVQQGDTVPAVVEARYYGLKPLECGYLNLGTKNDQPASFRADGAGFFPASQWRNESRVAAQNCVGQLKPGQVAHWNPSFYVPPATAPGEYLTGEFHPVYDAPGPQGGHSGLNIPIKLRVVPRAAAPQAPAESPRAAYRRCLSEAKQVKSARERKRARRKCAVAYRKAKLERCLARADRREGGARKRLRARCRARYGRR
jgi:hypothetical protein